jgi:transcriptional regulator with XRE-family HTH domain
MSRRNTVIMNNLSIGERIIKLRESLGLERKDLAKEINMSLGNISKLERNKINPSKGLLKALTMHFAVNPDWILTGTGEMFFGAEEYIGSGIQLFGDQEMSKGLAKALEDPQYAKFHALVTAGSIIQSDIDGELAAYLQYILKMWHTGERDRHWVMKQLEKAFEEVGQKLKEEKKK